MNITKQRLEQLIKEEYTAFLDNLSDEERADVLFEEKHTSASWRQAIKRDAGLGSMDSIRTIGDLGGHSVALDRSEREQVVAGADPKDIRMPHLKRRSALKARARAERRAQREKERQDRELSTGAFTDPDAPMTADQSLMQEDGHEDVPSAVRAMKAIIEDAEDLIDKLNDTNGNLPTWWTNKMAVAVHSLNKMRDYLVIDSEEE